METLPIDVMADVRAELAEPYDYYTTYVSMAQMAISLETATWVGVLARSASSAVDFGSGFTSYVLRKYCPNVWSVDDSPEWLEYTRAFLNSRRVKTEQLVLMDDYPPAERDLVVYDFAGGETRNEGFMFAFSQVSPGGTIVVDDMQFDAHADHAREAAEVAGMDLRSAKSWTLDAFGRFASYAVR